MTPIGNINETSIHISCLKFVSFICIYIYYTCLFRQLDQNGKELLQGIPRAVEEVGYINTQASQTRIFLQQLLGQLTQIDQQNNHAVRFLSAIDTVKVRVDTCMDTLTEVRSWELHARDIESCFEKRDLQAAATRLVQMKTGLERTRELPEFKSRQKQLKELQEQLEVMALARLTHVLHPTHHSNEDEETKSALDILQELCEVFSRLERSSLVRTEYLSSRRLMIHSLCNNFLQLTQSASNNNPEAGENSNLGSTKPSTLISPIKFSLGSENDWIEEINKLPILLEEILEFLKSEIRLLSGLPLFTEDVNIAPDLIGLLEAELPGRLSRWLDAQLTSAGDQRVKALLRAAEGCTNCLNRVFTITQAQQTQGWPQVTQDFDGFCKALMAPISLQTRSYPAMEETYLCYETIRLLRPRDYSNNSNNNKNNTKPSPYLTKEHLVSDPLQTETRTNVFRIATDSFTRCASVCGGVVTPALFKKLDGFLCDYLKYLEEKLNKLKQQLVNPFFSLI